MRRSTCRRLLAPFCETLTYEYNRFDTFLNAAVLAVVSSCLITASVQGELHVGALFWLAFALFAGAVQLIAGVLIGTLGFSLVWCALFGVMLYEELRWRLFSAGARPAWPGNTCRT